MRSISWACCVWNILRRSVGLVVRRFCREVFHSFLVSTCCLQSLLTVVCSRIFLAICVGDSFVAIHLCAILECFCGAMARRLCHQRQWLLDEIVFQHRILCLQQLFFFWLIHSSGAECHQVCSGDCLWTSYTSFFVLLRCRGTSAEHKKRSVVFTSFLRFTEYVFTLGLLHLPIFVLTNKKARRRPSLTYSVNFELSLLN